jgi:hypothetical protein
MNTKGHELIKVLDDKSEATLGRKLDYFKVLNEQEIGDNRAGFVKRSEDKIWVNSG